MTTRVSFVAGDRGAWAIDSIVAIAGPTLPLATALDRLEGDSFRAPADAAWILDGVRSNDRYVTQLEKAHLVAVSPALGRSCGVLIPITKTDAWWALAQDERRELFEERSRHVAIGLEYLPAIARRLYHARDLGGPFDFLTWFEFSPGDRGAFDHLLARLRETEEWRYVAHEVEIRVTAR